MPDLTFFKRNAVNYYGVFLKGYDNFDPKTDRLTMVRKNYYESGLQRQKRKFIETGKDGKVYKYEYSLHEDTVLKWQVLNDKGRKLETVHYQRNGDNYRVETRDPSGRLLKCTYFGLYHNWIKTQYYGKNGTEPEVELVYWDKNAVSILKFTKGGDDRRPEVLYPCDPLDPAEDAELLGKITARLGTPEVCTICSNGMVYFATERIARRWNRFCKDPALLDEIKPEPIFSEPLDKNAKRIDLTRTDDVIVPESAAEDNLIFSLDRDKSEKSSDEPEGEEQSQLPPARQWGKKLHSDSLDDLLKNEDRDKNRAESGSEPERVKNVFDILFDEDEASESDAAEENTAEGDGNANEEDGSRADQNEGEDSVGDLSREYDISSPDDLSDRSYGYKRVRPPVNRSGSLDELAEMKTVEIMKQSLAEALGQEDISDDIAPKGGDTNDKPKIEEDPKPETVSEIKPHAVGLTQSTDGVIAPTKIISASKGEEYYYYGRLNEKGERTGRGRTAMRGDLTAYEGDYVDDKRDGFGAYYYSNGSICYIGDWADNRRNGVGISFKSQDRSMYVGRWENNCPVGMGVKFDENGELKFVGRWENGTREGVGMIYNRDDESVFVSRWEDDRLSDKGTLFDSNGNLIYNGSWKHGKRNGIGTQYDADGQVSYHGEWKDGKFNGKGVLTLSNGCRVSGSFVMGAINGYAVFTTKRGKKLYEGEWVKNRFQGEGRKFNLKTGSWYKGSFSDGRPVGILSCYDRDDMLIYEGELRNELYHGEGTAYENGEPVYEGEWKNGVRSGIGSEYKNGTLVYKGKFKDNVRRGIGTSYNPDGTPEYSGHWSDDRKDGEGLLYKNGEPFLAGNFVIGVPDGRVNEIKNGIVVRECIYNDGSCVYMREFTDDGLSVKYEGYVKDGVYEGMGCGFSPYGEKYFEGIFKNGKPFKSMKVRLQRLDDLPVRTKLIGSDYSRFVKGPNYVIEREIGTGSYSGMLAGGRPTGKGTIIYTDHGYTGHFEDGCACGVGVIYEWDGSEVKGTFAKTAGINTTEITFADGITYHILKDSLSGR